MMVRLARPVDYLSALISQMVNWAGSSVQSDIEGKNLLDLHSFVHYCIYQMSSILVTQRKNREKLYYYDFGLLNVLVGNNTYKYRNKLLEKIELIYIQSTN